jgi:hypothetical protein
VSYHARNAAPASLGEIRTGGDSTDHPKGEGMDRGTWESKMNGAGRRRKRFSAFEVQVGLVAAAWKNFISGLVLAWKRQRTGFGPERYLTDFAQAHSDLLNDVYRAFCQGQSNRGEFRHGDHRCTHAHAYIVDPAQRLAVVQRSRCC